MDAPPMTESPPPSGGSTGSFPMAESSSVVTLSSPRGEIPPPITAPSKEGDFPLMLLVMSAFLDGEL